MVENFLECYHCATAHPGFSSEVDVHPDRYLLEAHPTFCRAVLQGDARPSERGQFHLLYPNVGINVFPGPANLSIGPIVPHGPGRTERYLDYFFAPDVDARLARGVLRVRRPGRAARTRRSSSPCTAAWPPGVLEQGRLLLNAEPLPRGFPDLGARPAQRDIEFTSIPSKQQEDSLVKRLFALAATAALAFTIAAVAGARTTAAPTMTPGTLVIGFGDPAVNFANGKVSGSDYINPKGFEVDLATTIAKDLGLTPKYVFTPWAKLFAPGHKSFDISFQEATITAQRKKTVDFTSSYFDANQGVLLSKKASDAALDRRSEAAADLRSDRHDRPRRGSSRSCIRRRRRSCTSRPPPRSSPCRSAGATRSSSTRRSSPPRRRRGPSRYGAIAGQIITHEQYGAVLQKGSKLTPLVDAADREALEERHDRQAPEEVVQRRLLEDPGPQAVIVDGTDDA